MVGVAGGLYGLVVGDHRRIQCRNDSGQRLETEAAEPFGQLDARQGSALRRGKAAADRQERVERMQLMGLQARRSHCRRQRCRECGQRSVQLLGHIRTFNE